VYGNSGGAGENTTANTTRYQCCSGLCIDLLNMLSEKIGLELDLFEVPDRKFGSYDRVPATVGPRCLSGLAISAKKFIRLAFKTL